MKITDKQVREYILANPDHIKVTIKRDGQIIVHTNEHRGDGGPTPWSMYWGDRTDAISAIRAEASN